MKVLATAALVLAACGDNAPPPPEGPHVRYVVSELHLPSHLPEPTELALDLDGDGYRDNQLGQVFVVLADNELSVAETAHDALLRGGLIMLADLQTTAFDDAPMAAFTTFIGADPSPAPCEDPARLETCGRHLDGSGSFSVQPSSASDPAIAPIADSTFVGRGGVMPLQLVLDDGSPAIRLDLHHARVELTTISKPLISAVLGGAITEDDIHTVVIPQAQAQVDRIVRTECGQASAPPPCGCPSGSRAAVLQALFDYAPQDCRISSDEIADNSLVQSLLFPDVVFGEERLLSFGVGVELVPARFEP